MIAKNVKPILITGILQYKIKSAPSTQITPITKPSITVSFQWLILQNYGAYYMLYIGFILLTSHSLSGNHKKAP